jgi:hypothetical protein
MAHDQEALGFSQASAGGGFTKRLSGNIMWDYKAFAA